MTEDELRLEADLQDFVLVRKEHVLQCPAQDPVTGACFTATFINLNHQLSQH